VQGLWWQGKPCHSNPAAKMHLEKLIKITNHKDKAKQEDVVEHISIKKR